MMMSIVPAEAKQTRTVRPAAFTLVELLVVIGIIAVLIAILLPSLSKAREAANRIKCAATIRELGMICQMYMNDSKGSFPGYYNPQWFNSVTNSAGSTWYEVITNARYVPNVRGSNSGQFNQRFACPSQQGANEVVVEHKRHDYGLNAMTYPNPAAWPLLSAFPGGRKLTTIPRPSERIMFIDNNPAPKTQTYAVFPWVNPTYIYPVHGGGTNAAYGGVNVAYVDGHVEFKMLTDLPRPTDFDYTTPRQGFEVVWGHPKEFR